jgi:hypothetical protein
LQLIQELKLRIVESPEKIQEEIRKTIEHVTATKNAICDVNNRKLNAIARQQVLQSCLADCDEWHQTLTNIITTSKSTTEQVRGR